MIKKLGATTGPCYVLCPNPCYSEVYCSILSFAVETAVKALEFDSVSNYGLFLSHQCIHYIVKHILYIKHMSTHTTVRFLCSLNIYSFDIVFLNMYMHPAMTYLFSCSCCDIDSL